MRIIPASLITLALAGIALAQTPTFTPPPSLQSNAAPHGPTPPKPPVKPTSTTPQAASSPDIEAQAQVAMFKAALDAQQDLKELMGAADAANRRKAGLRAVSSNPCSREGKGAAITCLDQIKARIGEMKLTSEDRFRLDQQFAIFRDAALTTQQPGTISQRAARLAAAQKQADELDKLLTELAKAKPPKPQQPLTIPGLGGILPGLGN